MQSHEPLIALDLFDQVQGMIGDAADRCKGSPKSMHPFTGLLRCGVCGEALQTETANGNGGHYAYYNCRSALQGVRCRGQRQRADDVDEALSSAIFARVLSRENLSEVAAEIAGERRNWSRDINDRRRSILATIQEHQRRNESLYQLLELHGQDAPNLGDLTKRLRGNNAAIKDAENQLAGLDAERDTHVVGEPEIEALGEFMRAALSEASNAARAREFYRGFIESIVVKEGEAEIRYDPAKLLAQNSPVRSTVNWRPVFASLRTLRTLRVTLRAGRARALRAAPARSA